MLRDEPHTVCSPAADRDRPQKGGVRGRLGGGSEAGLVALFDSHPEVGDVQDAGGVRDRDDAYVFEYDGLCLLGEDVGSNQRDFLSWGLIGPLVTAPAAIPMSMLFVSAWAAATEVASMNRFAASTGRPMPPVTTRV